MPDAPPRWGDGNEQKASAMTQPAGPGGGVLGSAVRLWALLFGVFLLLAGNGLQGTLLGVVAEDEREAGTVSVRESYHAVLDALGADHTLISELYWRDFFHHVAHFNPEVFGEAYQSKYRGGVLDWEGTREMFERWCEGRTGFPIVDAGIRQLVRTGWMHNRVRMIVASFLTKDLRCDWRWGERFFAQHLVDYDPCVNNGNWQWAASTGCDAQPYFRIFNPWSQQERYDPGAEYIQEYVEELADVEASVIHSLEDERVDSYPAPMVDHSVQRERTLSMFKSV